MLLSFNASEALLLETALFCFMRNTADKKEKQTSVRLHHLIKTLYDRASESTEAMPMVCDERIFVVFPLSEREKELLKSAVSCYYNRFIQDWQQLYEPESDFFEQSVLNRHSKNYELTMIEFIRMDNCDELKIFMSLAEKLGERG